MTHFVKIGSIFILLLFTSVFCQAWNDRSYFQNFVINNHKIYVLHADGILKIFDDDTGSLLDTYIPESKIKLLTQDHDGEVVIIDNKNRVRRLVSKNEWVTIATCTEGTLYSVTFNNDNECYLITSNGILDVKTRKLYFPEKKLYHSEHAVSGNNYSWVSEDNDIGTYMDNDNDLWVSVGHGEWGTDMFILNTKNFNFISFKNWIAMPVYEKNGHLFARESSFSGDYIVQYDKVYNKNEKMAEFVGSEVYSSEKDSTYQKAKNKAFYTQPIDTKHVTGRELDSLLNLCYFYLGGFTFNPSNGKIYIISSEGLLVGDQVTKSMRFGDLRQTKTFNYPKDIIKAYSFYNNTKNEVKFSAVYPLMISKLQFTTKDKIIMLAPDYGVWLFDGKRLRIME